MRLKDADKEFSGDIGECWSEFVDQYTQFSNDYHLTPQQRLLYLHIIRGKDAQRFYSDRVHD